MALRLFKCKICGHELETLRNRIPECNHNNKGDSVEMEEVLSAPNQKFMITANAAEGKSKLKDADKILKARARNHSRDVLGDETIQINTTNGLKGAVAKNLLNEKGQRRRKIDDL